jgi:hypothetical protein
MADGIRFDAPDKPGETVRLDELAVFGLYVDVIKSRIVELTNRAMAGTEGYDLVVKDQPRSTARLAGG